MRVVYVYHTQCHIQCAVELWRDSHVNIFNRHIRLPSLFTKSTAETAETVTPDTVIFSHYA